jgi:hypothetical protein
LAAVVAVGFNIAAAAATFDEIFNQELSKTD